VPQDHSAAQQNDVNQDWSAMLDEQGVQFLALDRHDDSDLLGFFRSQPGWTVDFEDEEAAILVRADVARAHGGAGSMAKRTLGADASRHRRKVR
jgi:hypothetical protein